MKTAIEHRIDRFHDLHNNKWFHIMNWNLDTLRAWHAKDYKNGVMLAKYGSCFYF
jgi:hypothetical protein